MSRHSTLVKIGGVELVVVAGWDRPLQYFFLDVETPERGDDDDAVYASMYDSRLFGAGRSVRSVAWVGMSCGSVWRSCESSCRRACWRPWRRTSG